MTKSSEQSADELKALSKELGVSIPSDAKILGVHRESGIDDMTRAKFLLTAQAYARLATTLPIQPDALRPGVGRLGTDNGFWNPHATPRLRSGTVALPNGRYLLTGVAESPEGVLLFVANHGT